MSVFIYLLTIINVVLIRCNDMKPETHLCNRSGANLSSTYNPKTPQWRVCLLLYLSKRCMLSLINCSPIQTPNFFWSNHYIWNLLSLLQAVRDSREIGHFRVPKTLTFKRWPNAQPFLWKWVLLAWKIVSISKAKRLTSFWYRGPGELGNSLSRKREHESKTWGNWGEEERLSYKSSAHIFACLSLTRHPHYPNPLDSTTSCKRQWPPHRAD